MPKTGMTVDFDMLIPHYKDEVYLSQLLHDVLTTNLKHKPNNIHIVNDGEASEDFITVCSEYSKFLPIKIYEVGHAGHIKIIHDFMLSTDAKNVLISHSDTGLICNNPNITYPDPVSVLGFYISDNDIAGVSCYALSTGEGIHKQASESDRFISYGARTLVVNSVLSTTHGGFKASYPLREVFGEFQRCMSFDDKFYALKTSVFRNVNGFNSKFFDYMYYLDDYFARCRKELDWHAVFTNETAVKHEVRSDKPENSLAISNGDKVQLFNDIWGGTSYITMESVRGEITSQQDIRLN